MWQNNLKFQVESSWCKLRKTSQLIELHFLFRFTAIVGDKRYSAEGEDPTDSSKRKSLRLSSSPPDPLTDSSPVYPNVCQLCGSYRKQHNKIRYTPYKILTQNTATAIKNAAKDKREELYREIAYLDIVAREFHVHDPCYKDLTLDYYQDMAGKPESSSDATQQQEHQQQEKTSSYSRSNYEGVKQYVYDSIIQEKKPASMKLLHEIYGVGIGCSAYRQKLKARLEKDFGEKICFLSQKNKTLSEIVISSAYFTADTVLHSKEQTIKHAAKILRNSIFEKFESFSMDEWPPDPTRFNSAELQPPEIVQMFIKSLLQPASGNRTPNIDRIVDCLSQDIVFNVLNRQVPLKKHFLLGLGLHSLTGSRELIDILSKFGSCISYNYVCDVETAYAEVAQEKAKLGFTLPIQPILRELAIFSHFWVDNFDVLIDKQSGGGSINTTHIVAFQKPNKNGTKLARKLSVPRRKSRQLFMEDINIDTLPVNKKQEPPSTFAERSEITTNTANFNNAYLIWIYLRKIYSVDQLVPTFKGFKLEYRKTKEPQLCKTSETYLTPLNSKVTEYQTIQRYMKYLQGLAKQVNMPSVNITLDVGAAINAYLVIWNNPVLFKNIIIHLGSFHFLKENFQVLFYRAFSFVFTLKLLRKTIFNDGFDFCFSGSFTFMGLLNMELQSNSLIFRSLDHLLLAPASKMPCMNQISVHLGACTVHLLGHTTIEHGLCKTYFLRHWNVSS